MVERIRAEREGAKEASYQRKSKEKRAGKVHRRNLHFRPVYKVASSASAGIHAACGIE